MLGSMSTGDCCIRGLTKTLVYRYGLLAPVAGADVVEAQLRAAHRYRNDLVMIERGRRAAVRALTTEHPQQAALEASAVEIETQLLAVITAVKKTRTATVEQVATVAGLRSILREAKGAVFLGRAYLRRGSWRRVDPERLL